MDVDKREALLSFRRLLLLLLLLPLVSRGLCASLVLFLLELLPDAILLEQVLAALLGLGQLGALVGRFVQLLGLLRGHGRLGRGPDGGVGAIAAAGGQFGDHGEFLLNWRHPFNGDGLDRMVQAGSRSGVQCLLHDACVVVGCWKRTEDRPLNACVQVQQVRPRGRPRVASNTNSHDGLWWGKATVQARVHQYLFTQPSISH